VGEMSRPGEALHNVDAEEFSRLMTELSDAEVIDVRTYPEFSVGHLEGAQLYDVMEADWAERIAGLDREKPYLVYCRSGSRSYHAGLHMQDSGFREVYNLAGGIISWTGVIVND
jgi:rhodanese-related sulfurtransferase